MYDYLIYQTWMKKLNIPSTILKAEKRLVKNVGGTLQKLGKTLSLAVERGELDNSLMIQLTFDRLVPSILNELQRVYTRGWRIIRKKLNLVTASDYVLYQSVKYIQSKRNEMLGSSSLSITQTTKEHIADVITKGLQEWKPYTELAQDIIDQTEHGILSPARAQLIAVRELWDAYENGRRITLEKHMQTTGDRAEKIWDTVNDSRVTPQCRTNEAEGWILFNEKFPSGDDQAPRNANPRCRCTTNYRLI